MKKKEFDQLKNLSVKELLEKVREIKKEITQINFDLAAKKIKNVHTKDQKRKIIAKILTLIREKEFAKEQK